MMRVGVDFDNTIVCYDILFHRIAVEQHLIPSETPVAKGQVRDYLRRIGREDDWTALQGQVYGSRLQEAEPFPGVVEFFAHCRERGWITYIISHKTRYPFLGQKHDLHQAAYRWLETYGFRDPSRLGLTAEQVYFEVTKQAKLERIAGVGCDYFIDDLPEFLTEPQFPASVRRILFAPNGSSVATDNMQPATSWGEIEALLSHWESPQ